MGVKLHSVADLQCTAGAGIYDVTLGAVFARKHSRKALEGNFYFLGCTNLISRDSVDAMGNLEPIREMLYVISRAS